MKSEIVLITGASSGIGRASAVCLRKAGHIVYGGSRTSSRAPDQHELRLDVNDEAEVLRGVEFILQKEGRLDVVVNCAGFGIAGAIEDTSLEEAKAQFETNFFGVVRVCRAVLPLMRQQKQGLIVNISSIGGLVGLPFQGFYSASKFAVEGFTEALRMEVAPFGIRVVLLEPGDFRTQFTANRRKVKRGLQNEAYQDNFRRAVGVIESDETRGSAPEIIARLLHRILEHPSPRLRYTVGPVMERLVIPMKLICPHRFYEWVMRKHFELS